MADTEQIWDFSGLRAMFLNGTLKRSPEVSNTEGLIEVSASIMRAHGVEAEVLRAFDHDIATGVYPDMTEQGWASDDWPQIWERVKAAHILVIAGPIWLVTTRASPSRSSNGCMPSPASSTTRASTPSTAGSVGL
jgi:hypothetical protein